MSETRFASSHRKKDGFLSISANFKTIQWLPNSSSGSNAVTIDSAEIINLQQTPPQNPRASVKLVVKRANQEAVENHVFTFTSADPRQEQASFTSAARKALEVIKAQDSVESKETGDKKAGEVGGGGPSGNTQTTAGTTVPKPRAGSGIPDEKALISDVDLQMSLLNSDPALRKRLDESLREKPESIKISQFAKQFWSTRVRLLHAHASAKNQKKGVYNVLSEVKPKNVDGTARLNLSKEQIQLIFQQHPLVKRVYEENTPYLSETEFWSKFFVSRLFKSLRGAKITELDPTDKILDKYLNCIQEDEGRAKVMAHSAVPHSLNLEGNEQDHSQRRGNRVDWTMRPSSREQVPITRALNSMSEKLMAEVGSSDGNLYGPAGVSERAHEEFKLRDLTDQTDDNRRELKIRNIGLITAVDQSSESQAAQLYSSISPAQVVQALNENLKFGILASDEQSPRTLDSVAGSQNDSDDSEDNFDRSTRTRFGSKAGWAAATVHILSSDRERVRNGVADDTKWTMTRAGGGGRGATDASMSADAGVSLNLPAAVAEKLLLMQNTKIEFLHYFWSVFLSGDEDRAVELHRVVETLKASLDRIREIAEEYEKARAAEIAEVKAAEEDRYRRTGKRRKINMNSLQYSARPSTVTDLMAPTVKAIRRALDENQAALKASKTNSNVGAAAVKND